MKNILRIAITILLTAFSQIANSQSITFKEDSIRAVNLYRNGRELGQQNLNSEALKNLLEGLEIRKRIYGENNYRRLANSYYYIGMQYNSLGNYDLAIKYEKLSEIAFKHALGADHPVLISIYRNLGNIYRAKLNYLTALQYYNQIVNFYYKQKNPNKEQLAGIYYSIAEVYYLQNNYKKAISLSLENVYFASSTDKILYYELLAANYRILGKNDSTKYYYQKAIDQTIELYNDETRALFNYLQYTNFLIDTKKYKQANAILEKVKTILFATDTLENENLSLYYKTEGYLAEKKPIKSSSSEEFDNQRVTNLNKALTWYNLALDAVHFPVNIKHINIAEVNPTQQNRTLNILRAIANVHTEISKVYEGKVQERYTQCLSDALDYYNISSLLIQKFRKEITSDEGRIALSGIERSNILDIVRTAYLAYEFDKSPKYLNLALQNAEQLKSSSIYDKLSTQLAAENSLIPDSLLNLEKQLNTEIANFNQNKQVELSTPNSDSLKLVRIDSTIFNLTRQRDNLMTYLDNNFPNYYNLKYANNQITIDEIQSKLKNNDLLIEYIINTTDSLSNLYTLTISKNTFNFYVEKIDSTFTIDIQNLFDYLSNTTFLFTKNKDSKIFCQTSNRIYKKLFRPFENETAEKNLIIVPDGILNYLPFDGLITEMPDTNRRINFSKLEYLLKKNATNYAYSANLFFQFKKTKKTAHNNILAFAPDYENDTIVIDNAKIPLSPLPGTKKEVKLVAGNLKSKRFIGQNATEINFRQNCENYDILHLAMHALLSDKNPALSKFAFSLNKNSNNPKEDGWLTTADIYNMNLNARLTTLSACNTGSGELRKGEGVMSLARGFIYAGCPSILMSLWEVEDQSGTEIINLFYKNLRKGKTKDQALRLAKIEYLENANPRLAHPHYWQGFVIIGDNSALYRSYDYYFFGFLILAVIGIITDQLIRLKKARKNAG